VPNNAELKTLSDVFGAPFTLYSNNISGSFRSSCDKMNVKMLLFEGGKSVDINNAVTKEAVEGTKRFLMHFGMLKNKHEISKPHQTIYIEKSDWIRANFSGMFHGLKQIGSYVTKGELLATISDPFGKVSHKLKAPHAGYLINVNDAPIVYQGDAVFHISTKLENDEEGIKNEV
jgi:predicted deacylase